MFKVFVVSFLMLKVLAHTFGCWRFLLLLFDVKGYSFYSWLFKVLIFGFKCWKFLLLFLDIEGSYFCFWMFKVFALILRCWKFLLLDVKGLWFLVLCLLACIYLKWCENIFLFKSWLYKFSLTYYDERFMNCDFSMIIMLHMSCFVFEHLWWHLLFLCYRVELSLCFINIKIICTRWNSFKSIKTHATQYFAIIFQWFNESFHIF